MHIVDMCFMPVFAYCLSIETFSFGSVDDEFLWALFGYFVHAVCVLSSHSSIHGLVCARVGVCAPVYVCLQRVHK